MLKNKIKEAAARRGVKTAQALSFMTRLTWPTAHGLLTRETLDKIPLGSIQAVADALEVSVTELYEVVKR